MKCRMLSLSLIALTAALWGNSPDQINKQIDQLEEQINHFRVDKLNVNTEAQHYMLGQPTAYSDAMKRIDAIDDEIDILENRLSKLKAEHDRLLKEINTPKQ
jgi:prefoldin subunit 5